MQNEARTDAVGGFKFIRQKLEHPAQIAILVGEPGVADVPPLDHGTSVYREPVLPGHRVKPGLHPAKPEDLVPIGLAGHVEEGARRQAVDIGVNAAQVRAVNETGDLEKIGGIGALQSIHHAGELAGIHAPVNLGRVRRFCSPAGEHDDREAGLQLLGHQIVPPSRRIGIEGIVKRGVVKDIGAAQRYGDGVTVVGINVSGEAGEEREIVGDDGLQSNVRSRNGRRGREQRGQPG
jgi:hypothetical protein